VLIGGVACTAVTDTPSPALQATAEVTVTLPAVHLGPDAIQAASADIQLIPANRAQAVLGRQTRAADQFTQAVTVPVNIAPCSGATTSCSAVMVVRFLNAAGVMIDSTEAGPFTIIGGGRTAAPSVQAYGTKQQCAPTFHMMIVLRTHRISCISGLPAHLTFENSTLPRPHLTIVACDERSCIIGAQ
jgi:hypothetical protein